MLSLSRFDPSHVLGNLIGPLVYSKLFNHFPTPIKRFMGKFQIIFFTTFKYITLVSPPSIYPYSTTTSIHTLYIAFKKEKLSQRHQLNTEASKGSIRLGKNIHIKPEKSNTNGGNVSQEQGKVSEIYPIPTLRSPTRIPSYTNITNMQMN